MGSHQPWACRELKPFFENCPGSPSSSERVSMTVSTQGLVSRGVSLQEITLERDANKIGEVMTTWDNSSDPDVNKSLAMKSYLPVAGC